VRSGKRLIPTPAAVRLAEHAKDLIKRMGQIKQEFDNDLATDIRPFHFAAGVTTLIYQLGKPLRQLRKQYPKTEIRVSVNVTGKPLPGCMIAASTSASFPFRFLKRISRSFRSLTKNL